jgi:hypothetical protein
MGRPDETSRGWARVRTGRRSEAEFEANSRQGSIEECGPMVHTWQERESSPAAATVLAQRPNDTRVRVAGPARKTRLTRKHARPRIPCSRLLDPM